MAKVLFLDIETAPLLGYTWGMWDQNVLKVKRNWFMLSFAYQWMDSKKIHFKGLPDYKGYKKHPHDDRKLLKDLHALLDEADVVVAHNGDRFDLRKINARLVFHGFGPPSTYKTIDTLKYCRSNFAFTSSKLDAVSRYLGIGRKLPHTGFDLWDRCMDGDPAAWRMMKKYNLHDVYLLVQTYYKLRAWAPNHPNFNLYDKHYDPECKRCPVCKSHNTVRQGIRVAVVRRYQRWSCNDCGHWFKGDAVTRKKRKR